jgi:hypothetical protein
MQVAVPSVRMNSSVLGSTYIPLMLEYNVSVPNNTDTTYSLSVTTENPNYRICSISINYVGINMGCFNVTSVPVISPVNRAVWNLGRIFNGGQRSLDRDRQANTIQFIIYLTPMNGSVATNVNAVLTYGPSLATVTATTPITLVPNNVSTVSLAIVDIHG